MSLLLSRRNGGVLGPLVLALLVIVPVLFSAGAVAQEPPIVLNTMEPVSSDALYLNLSFPEDCLAVVVLHGDDTGLVVFQELVTLVGGNASLGPFSLPSGNYTANTTFWVVANGSFAPVLHEFSFFVSEPPTAAERYGAMAVVVTGIGVVFFTLSVLAIVTFINGRILKNKMVDKPSAPGGGAPRVDDMEKIAAIAAAIRLRGV